MNIQFAIKLINVCYVVGLEEFLETSENDTNTPPPTSSLLIANCSTKYIAMIMHEQGEQGKYK